MDYKLSSQAIYSALKVDDCKVAEKLLERMDSSFGPPRLLELSEYYFLKTRLAILMGNSSPASHHAEASLRSVIEVRSPFFLGLRYLSKAHVAHELGRHRHAQEYCEHALSIARKTQNTLLTFSVFLAEAFFALDQGKESSGLQSLRKALAIGNSQGYMNTLIDQPSVMAIDAGIEVKYVQDLIRRHNLIPDNPMLDIEKWPRALKIYTLGRFVVLKNGQPIRFSRKAQQKPLSMLKALIAFGGREVRKDQIADALWPEADGDMGEQSFATTLHRLRKVIDYRNAIELQRERLTLNRRYSWVDVWEFERVFGQADAAWKKEPTGREAMEAVVLTRNAIDMYQGPFLDGESSNPWTISLRERCRSKFLRGVSTLGHYWEKAGQLEKAVQCYQRGLEADDLAEDLYQHLMTCYHRLGRRAEVLSVYERCERILSSSLGIEPSSETKAIRKSIFLQKS
jgi:DNA-binding SARP family transcriptional activator